MDTLNLLKNANTELSKAIDKLAPFIGGTPLFPVTGLHSNNRVKVFAKLEWQQFGGSVKSRPAYQIIKDAVKRNELTKGKYLLDASSGNTGIAYAQIGAALGIPVSLCLPENASEERKQILRALGVHIHYTSRMGTTDEAQEIAQTLYAENPDKYYYADQYNNSSNWESHYKTTGQEILDQTSGSITHFITGLGTTGTFTGIGRRLKKHDRKIQLIALQPDISMHGLEGWKHMESARIPGIFDAGLPDDTRSISTEKAYSTIPLAAKKEGLLLSPSSAANLAAALELADELDKGVIVTICPDDAYKYGEIINQLF